MRRSARVRVGEAHLLRALHPDDAGRHHLRTRDQVGGQFGLDLPGRRRSVRRAASRRTPSPRRRPRSSPRARGAQGRLAPASPNTRSCNSQLRAAPFLVAGSSIGSISNHWLVLRLHVVGANRTALRSGGSSPPRSHVGVFGPELVGAELEEVAGEEHRIRRTGRPQS